MDWGFWFKVGVETLTLFFILVGLFGLIIPIFPGLAIMWLAILIYGLLTGFRAAGWAAWVIFALISLLAIFGSVVDNFLMAVKAREREAAWVSLLLGFLAGVVFSFAFPPLGGLIAAPGALFLAEYLRRKKNAREAWEAVQALLVGWGWAFAARFAIGVVITGLWALWAWVLPPLFQ